MVPRNINNVPGSYEVQVLLTDSLLLLLFSHSNSSPHRAVWGVCGLDWGLRNPPRNLFAAWLQTAYERFAVASGHTFFKY